MTSFTMSANLTADKRLEFVTMPLQNQGENKTTSLQITVPSAVSDGNDFYLEFACPHGRKYLSTLLEKETVNGEVVLTYQMPNCLFADEGIVYVQLTARNQTDETIVFKSKLCSTSAFYVNKSVNACDEALVSTDFFIKAMQLLDDLENTDLVTTVNGKTGAVETYAGDYSSEKTYSKGDIVNTQNGLYICISNAPSGTAVTNTAYFKALGGGGSSGGGGSNITLYKHNVYVQFYNDYEGRRENAVFTCMIINTSATPIETANNLITALQNNVLAVNGKLYGKYYIENGEYDEKTYDLKCVYKYPVNTDEPAVYCLKFDTLQDFEEEDRHFVFDNSEYCSDNLLSCSLSATDYVEQIGGEL